MDREQKRRRRTEQALERSKARKQANAKRRRYLLVWALVAGSILFMWALSSPGGGSDPGMVQFQLDMQEADNRARRRGRKTIGG